MGYCRAMPSLTEKTTIPSPADRVWPLLRDPALVASCIPGASLALASGTVTVSGDDIAELSVDGSFSVSGPLETFANAGGVHVARALLAEFPANMAKKVTELPPVEAA